MIKKKGVLFVIVLLTFLLLTFSLALNFDIISEEDFNMGIYEGVYYNGTGLIINDTFLNGVYTSKIFDAGFDFIEWSNLTIVYSIENNSLLISADAQSSVWNSSDSGLNWINVIADYNGGDSNGAEDMAVNTTNSLFIMNNQDIWVSGDKGQSWTKVNDDFNGVESSVGIAMTIDKNNTIFAVDAGEGIWASYDSGTNFIKVNVSFNSGGQNAARIASNNSLGLFVVDSQSKVWASNDNGRNWIKVNDDFNGGVTNVGADGLRVNDSNSIYLIDRQKLWMSNDNGVTWTNINDDFNGGASSNAFSMTLDKGNNIYIIDGNEDVYFSNNQGITFSKIASNINGGNGAIRAFNNIFSDSSVRYQVRNCTTLCTNEPYFGPDLTANTYYSNLTSFFNFSGRYFQYKIFLSRNDLSTDAIVYNTSLGYIILNSFPEISLVHPVSGNYSSIQTTLNYTVFDANLQACWYSIDNGFTNTTITCGTNVTGLSSNQGNNFWSVYANDTVGLISSSNVSFFVDSIAPNILFNSGTLQSGLIIGNNSLFIGVDSNDELFANTTIFLLNSTSILMSNTSSSPSFNITYLGLTDGTYFYNASSVDEFNNRNNTETRNITIDTTSPMISILIPSNGSTLGDNVSIQLNYTIDEIHIDSCWYSIDNGVNVSLPSCSNSFFNTTDGWHSLRVYTNDSVGNIGFGDTSFSVQVGAPSIELYAPSNNAYLNYHNLSFNFTATDVTLSSCSLYGNFNGNYSLNKTDFGISSGANSIFNLSLNDGNYLWAISCNDSIGNRATTSNRTVHVDTLRPNVTINNPSGVYSSLSNIPISLSYVDASPVKCTYNVTFAATGIPVIGNSLLVDCEDTTFNVDTPSSYFLWMAVNDSAGNVNITRSSFTVSIPSGSGGGSSSGGGGGGGSIGFGGPSQFNLELATLEKLKINRGESEAIQLRAENKGFRFLNDCYFTANGGISDWISGRDIYSLSPGQFVDYIFSVSVPLNADIGEYFSTIRINCKEVNSSLTYQVEVTGGEFELTVLNSERIGTKLRVSYALENFADNSNNLRATYKFMNSRGNVLAEGSFDPIEVLSGERIEKYGEFELPKNSIGDYTLVMEVSDGLNIVSRQQQVRLTAGGISGFAISDNNLRTISWLALVIIISFAIFIVLKSLRHQIALRHATQAINRQFITIDLNH